MADMNGIFNLKFFSYLPKIIPKLVHSFQLNCLPCSKENLQTKLVGKKDAINQCKKRLVCNRPYKIVMYALHFRLILLCYYMGTKTYSYFILLSFK